MQALRSVLLTGRSFEITQRLIVPVQTDDEKPLKNQQDADQSNQTPTKLSPTEKEPNNASETVQVLT